MQIKRIKKDHWNAVHRPQLTNQLSNLAHQGERIFLNKYISKNHYNIYKTLTIETKIIVGSWRFGYFLKIIKKSFFD